MSAAAPRKEREDKPAWSALPASVKESVTRRLGSPVVRAVRSYGGFGPSATFRLVLADGRRAFFKGTYPLPEDSAVKWVLDREERVYRRLARYIRPWAPQYFGSIRAEGWHALLLEDLGGESVLPWTQAKTIQATRSYAAFHASTLGRRLPSWLSRTEHRDFATFWRSLARDPAALRRLASLARGHRHEALAWLGTNVAALRRAERALFQAPEPFALMHFDTRSDNTRLEGDLLRIFDWPFASVGPHEFELAAFAQAIAAEGGPRCELVADWYETVLPLRRDVLVGSIAGISGYFADRAPRPPLAGLPRLRSIQRRQLKASLEWSARLLGLPDPAWLAAVPDQPDVGFADQG